MIPIRHLIFGLLTGLAASAVPIQFQSSDRQVALVELYTSEGCNSCPPAESWLSRLQQAPGLWSDFVPVAFHVDYWDYLGWRDKWASKQFSDRQRACAQAWRNNRVYTPAFVLNGQEWLGRKDAFPTRRNKAGVLSVRSEDSRRWQVTFAPAPPLSSSYEVHAALLASGLVSDVKAGENAGRRLRHDFTVLGFTAQPLLRKNDRFEGGFTTPVQSATPEGRLALAVWATRSGRLDPVQAVGGWLAAPDKTK
jgi:hypothetical protein